MLVFALLLLSVVLPICCWWATTLNPNPNWSVAIAMSVRKVAAS